jgi:cyclohexanone monooxygenase
MLYSLRQLGLTVRLFESAPEVGGVWYWNRYPGARCDVESADYSYSFSEDLEQEWTWPEKYSTRQDILRYLNHVVDRFNLRGHIELQTPIKSAGYEDERWNLELARGETVHTQFLIMATGCLSVPKSPDIRGSERFEGQIVHSAAWPEEGLDLEGKRVGIIGVGSSGTQMIPLVARVAKHLYVFQRTPNYTLPGPNEAADQAYTSELKRQYRARRAFTRSTTSGLNLDMSRTSALSVTSAERDAVFETYWEEAGFGFQLAFSDLLTSDEANAHAREFVAGKIRSLVEDPETARLLTPTDYPIGVKRPSIDAEFFSANGGYYASFNRPNVSLIDLLSAPILELTTHGIRTASADIPLDVIVFATGFDAMTGALLGLELVGRNGQTLKSTWSEGPRSYLGLAVHGFPNLFILAGPGSPSVLSNVVVSIEQHVEWLTDLISFVTSTGIHEVEASPQAEDMWVSKVNEVANGTLYPNANSWYLGANIPGKPRVFMPYAGGLRSYRRICDQVASQHYEGFDLRRQGGPRNPLQASAREL